MIQQQLKTCIDSIINKQFPTDALKLEIPAQSSHGDYAFSLAFQLAKSQRTSPIALAIHMSEMLNGEDAFIRIAKAQPLNGFVNIILQDSWIMEAFFNLFLSPSPYPPSNQSILLEFVSANPTGPLHIGHGRWAVLGKALASIYKATGAVISTEDYINDGGHQIALLEQSIHALKHGHPIPEGGYHGAYLSDLLATNEAPHLYILKEQRQTLAQLD